MGSHPINLSVRFLLEMAALVASGFWGYLQTDKWFRFILALGIPIILATLWGIFAVANDPSRSGAAPINTPGTVRLLLELAFFSFAAWCLNEIEFTRLSIFFVIVVIAHYIISYDRIVWLLKH